MHSQPYIVDAIKELIARVEEHTPPCRERSLAITKLQEAEFWLVAIPADAWTKRGQTVGGRWDDR